MSLQKFNTLVEYTELNKWLQSLKDRDLVSAWSEAMRWYCQNDLFFLLTEVIAEGKIIHSDTGKPFYFDQFYLDWCRLVEWQMQNGGGFDASARGSGKSAIRTKASNIQRILVYPDSSGCIFSAFRKFSKKHFNIIKEELETNILLKTLFDDVLYMDPRSAAKTGDTIWSAEDGFRVKRKMMRRDNTLEYNAFFDGTPTGGRYDRLDFDDIEDHKSTSTEWMLEKLHSTYDATIPLLTASAINPPYIMFTNTFYSDIGLAKRVWKQMGDEDQRKARVYPGEDLSLPGNGPLGGTPQYPYTQEGLTRWYNQIRDKSEYAVQICCDFLAGADRRFEENWLVPYPSHPDIWGKNKNIYICIDPSGGKNDPTCMWVWALGSDKKFSWVDCVLKKLDPALPEFFNEVHLLYSKWNNLGRRVVEIRIENFGQASFASMLKRNFDDLGISVDIVSCADNLKTGKFNSGKRDREFERWAYPASTGLVAIPLSHSKGGSGLIRDIYNNERVDLVDYFMNREWTKFPKPVSDNMLDAGSLIWEPEDKIDRVLQFPPASIKAKLYSIRSRRTSAMSMG